MWYQICNIALCTSLDNVSTTKCILNLCKWKMNVHRCIIFIADPLPIKAPYGYGQKLLRGVHNFINKRDATVTLHPMPSLIKLKIQFWFWNTVHHIQIQNAMSLFQSHPSPPHLHIFLTVLTCFNLWQQWLVAFIPTTRKYPVTISILLLLYITLSWRIRNIYRPLYS